jgi:pimeloyl-ACP methyl ester carboxylesterase
MAGPAAATSAPRTIVFSHANGFGAGTYRTIFAAWREAGFEVLAIDKYGHDPRYPVTSNWPHLRDQLIHFIEREVEGPAYLVGHSLGGYLSLLAAARRPDLAAGLVMLDSPVISGWKARAVQMAKAAGMTGHFSPGKVSKRRRQQWESADAAHAHFASKKAFARWEPGVLRDYIDSGTEAHGTLRRLAFDREVETSIYNTLPHHMSRMLRAHPLRCEMAFVRGDDSEEIRQVGMRATERLAQGRIVTIEGSHLFPFERPKETAEAVVKLIDSMGVGAKPTRL